MSAASRSLRAALLALTLGAAGCGTGDPYGGGQLAARPTAPDAFGEVADFSFAERRGGRVSRADLLGRPWLAGFFFTSCTTICPALTIELSRARAELDPLDVPVVAISVDPQVDTPAVLNEYARRFAGTESERWLFLTGDEEETHDLIRSSFQLAVERNPGSDPGLAVTHSSLLAVVGPDGRIRGYYDARAPGGTARAVARARYLAGDRSGLSALPGANASLNGLAALLLVAGWVAIRRGRRRAHAVLMQLAFLVSSAFLASYVYYHFVVVPAQGGPVRFAGQGLARACYLALLGTHVLGAVLNLPMVLRTLWLAYRERWDEHRRLARRTWPLWMYVSVTGVLVYAVLYRL